MHNLSQEALFKIQTYILNRLLISWEWLGNVRNGCFKSKNPCVLH